MKFRKISTGEGIIFELKAWDKEGGKIEQWKVMKQDFPRVIKILSKKYGLDIYVKERKGENDLDWAI